jgi:hypothetical protein
MAIPESLRSKIAQKILDRLALVTEFNYREFDKVKLTSADFAEHDLPAVQAIDLGDPNTHEMVRGKRRWNIALEIILGPTQTYEATQKKLWDLMEYTENTIFADPKLGLGNDGVVHMHLLDSYTDLHVMDPYYLGRIEIEVEYYQPLVRQC